MGEYVGSIPGRGCWVSVHAGALGDARGTHAGSAGPHQKWPLPTPPVKQHSS